MMARMASEKSKRWVKRLGVTVIILFICYVLFGFWGVPLIIRHVVLKNMNEAVAGHGEVEAIRFNPFTWELKLEHFAGYTPDGQEGMRFAEFRINVQPTSYFSDEWRVREITLDSPYLNLIIDENGQVNLNSSLQRLQEQVDKVQQAQTDDSPFVIPPIHIDTLHVVNAGLRAEINSLGQPFIREVSELSFTMDNVRTNAEHQNPYDFQLVTKQGERVKVNGELQLDPLSSWGNVTIDQLQLKDFLLFAGEGVGFEMGGGALDFAIDYAFIPLGESPRLELHDGSLSLTALTLIEKGQTEPFQRIDKLELTGLNVDVLHDKVSLDSFALDGAYLKVVRGGDGVLNLLRYITPPERHAAIAEEAAQEAGDATAPREIRLGVISANQDMGVALTSAWRQIQELVGLKWDLAAQQVDVKQVELVWRDEFLDRPAELRWSDIALTATNLSNGETPFPYDLGLTMNDTGSLSLKGEFTPTPARATFNFEVATLPLDALSPYLDNISPVRLVSGALSGLGQGEIAFPDEGLPELSAELDGSVAQFQLDWADPQAPLLAWSNVALSGASVTTRPMSFEANQLTISQPSLYLERQADGALRLPQPEGDDAPQSEPRAAPEVANIHLDELVIEGGAVMIRDQSVSPAAGFAAKEIQLRAGPFSNPLAEPMTFDLGLQLADGPTGAITVKGALDPLQPLNATELNVTTQSLTLAPFAPYAVSVIGQPPIEGALTADLGYNITSGKILGQNKMQIKTVRFGPRPPDTDAPSLPLDLGVAILEDSSGVMHIDIPIKGDINDPEFSLSRMIEYAIGNVLEKLVTAPFGMIGSILPGGEDGSPTYAPFEPGSSRLSAETQEGLLELAKFLTERPTLVATLTPSIDPEADADALREQQFDALLAARMQADNDDAEDATETLYQALPADPASPRPRASDLTIEQQQAAVKESITITEADFLTLSKARVMAVKAALTSNPDVAADRVVSIEDRYEEDGAKVIFGAEADLK